MGSSWVGGSVSICDLENRTKEARYHRRPPLSTADGLKAPNIVVGSE